jgi:hypothetical protein
VTTVVYYLLIVLMSSLSLLWFANLILIQSDNISRITSGSIGGYLSLSEAEEFMSELTQVHSQLITRYAIGKSLEGREMYAYKITAVFDSNIEVPKLLMTSLMHAREPLSLSASLFIISQLVEEYVAQVTDVEYLLRTRELYVIPMVNPDGYSRLSTTLGFRKNTRDTCPSDLVNSGVDLNRNFGFDWKEVANKCSEDYSGTGPFSEPETQNMRDFSTAKKFKSAVNFHAYGNILTIPYNGGIGEKIVNEQHMKFYKDIQAAWKFQAFGPSRETLNYTTHGESDDWFYDELGVLSMSPELGPQSAGFRPTSEEVRKVLFDIYPKIKLWMMRAGGSQIDAVRIIPHDQEKMGIEFENRGLESFNNATIVVRDDGLCNACNEDANCRTAMDGQVRVFNRVNVSANPLGRTGILLISSCPKSVMHERESLDVCVLQASRNCRCFKPLLNGSWTSIQVDQISNSLFNKELCEIGGLARFVDALPFRVSRDQDSFSLVSSLLLLIFVGVSIIQTARMFVAGDKTLIQQEPIIRDLP